MTVTQAAPVGGTTSNIRVTSEWYTSNTRVTQGTYGNIHTSNIKRTASVRMFRDRRTVIHLSYFFLSQNHGRNNLTFLSSDLELLVVSLLFSASLHWYCNFHSLFIGFRCCKCAFVLLNSFEVMLVTFTTELLDLPNAHNQIFSHLEVASVSLDALILNPKQENLPLHSETREDTKTRDLHSKRILPPVTK